jgi:hypothetical protein
VERAASRPVALPVSRWLFHPWLWLALLLASFTAWQLAHLGGFQWSLDEGLNLMRAWLVTKGFVLYREIWADQPPLFTAELAGVLHLAGNSVEAGRALTVLHASAGLLGVAWVVYELDRRWIGAMVAIALLALAPNFFWASRAVMPGLPALCLAVMSAGAMLAALRTGRRTWLAVAGVLLALSALEKLISVYLVLPLLTAVVLRPRPGGERRLRGLIGDVVVVGLAGVVPGLITLAVCDQRPLIEQVVGTYLRARDAYHLNLERNLQIIGAYLTIDNLGLTALAAFGALVLLRRHSVSDRIMLFWIILNLVAIATHTPLWPEHHLLPLLASLAILAGVAVNAVAGQIDQLRPRHVSRFAFHAVRPGDWVWLLSGLAALVVWLVALPRPIQVDARLLDAQSYDATGKLPGPRPYSDYWQVVEMLTRTTQPGDFVLTDSMMIAFRAGRLVPPWLSVLSRKRIETRELSDQDLIRAGLAYAPDAVLLWDDRLIDFPDFLAWLDRWYRPGPTFGQDRVFYLPIGLAAVEQPMRAVLGDQVELIGYRLERASIQPGETLTLTLFWRGLQPMTRSYTVFTHVLGPDGQIYGQKDSLPAAGLLPTTAWRPGVLIPDEYAIPMAPDAPPGNYELEIGMYELDTGRRLPAVDATGQRLADDRILLTRVTVRIR